MAYRAFRLAAVVTPLLSGCASEESGTAGELNNLRFAYSVPGVCEGCRLDREVLTGSSVTVDVFNINTRVNYGVRSTNPNVADFVFTPRCRVVGGAGCTESVTVNTFATGDTTLEMMDEWTGTVIDRVTVHVREASVIDTTVRETPVGGPSREVSAADGVYQLPVHANVDIISVARSTDGRELIAAPGSVRRVYADENVVGPRDADVIRVSSSTPAITEYAKAKTTGATTISFETNGLRHDLSFQVK